MKNFGIIRTKDRRRKTERSSAFGIGWAELVKPNATADVGLHFVQPSYRSKPCDI
jgi:hypothetical protein